MTIFAEFAQDADEILAEFGDTVTLGTKTASGNPWAATVATASAQITAVVMPVTAEMRAAGHVEADAILYARTDTIPKIGDTVIRGDERWTIYDSVRVWGGQGITVLIEADLKWAS